MYLSAIEQSPRSKGIYTQLCFCYPTTDSVSGTKIVERLTNGLKRLTVGFPWVAGQVVYEEASEEGSGIFKVVPLEEFPRLVVKECTHNDPALTWDVFTEAELPFSMLDEKMICPRMTLAGAPGEKSSDVAPVFLLQANFIAHGLLLTFAASHSVMDIVGQGQIIRLLSKACHDVPFTGEELRNGNLDRRNLIPLLGDAWRPDVKSAQQPDQPASAPASNSDTVSSCPAELTWAYFIFQSTSLAALKASASPPVPGPSNFISTDDALCALIWQAIARARSARLDLTTESIFTRAVDMRHILDVPETYTGNMASKTKTVSTLQDIAGSSLGVVALRLRSALVPEALEHDIRATATLQTRSQKPATASTVDRSKYIVMSSWSKVECHHVDFNLGLGNPISVRRPRFEPLEGVVYLLPKSLDGEIAAGLCLRTEDMQVLRTDEGLLRYARYIG